MSQRNVFDTEKKEEQQRRREYEKRLNHAIEEEELRRRVFNGRLSKMKEERDKNELKEGEKLRREEYIKILQYMKEYEHLRREEYEKINSLVQDIFNLKKVRVKLIRLKKSLIHFGYDEENFKNTGFTAREIIKAGFGVEELEAVGFTPAEIKLATSALKGSRDVQFNIRSSNSSQDMSEFIPDKINVRPYDHFDWVSALEQVKKEGLTGNADPPAPPPPPPPAPAPSRAFGDAPPVTNAFGEGFFGDGGDFMPHPWDAPPPTPPSNFQFGGPLIGGSRRKKNKKRKLTRKQTRKPSRKLKRKTRTLRQRRVKKTRLYKNKK